MGEPVKKLMLLSLLVLASCGTRKRELQESKVKYLFESSVDTSFNSKQQLERKMVELIKLNQYSKNTTIEYEGNEGDSLSVQQFGPGGKLISETKIKGKGKAKISESQEELNSDKKLEQTEETKSDVKASGKKKIKAAAAEKKSQLKVERDTSLIPWWLWILIVAVLILYLNYRFKLFPIRKKHVLKESDSNNTFV